MNSLFGKPERERGQAGFTSAPHKIPGYIGNAEARELILAGRAPDGFYTDRLHFKGHDSGFSLPRGLRVYDLVIEDCPNFISLPDDLLAQRITVRRCVNFKNLPKGDGVVDLTIDQCPRLVDLPNKNSLIKVNIIRCPGLTALPRKFKCTTLEMPGSSLASLPEGISVRLSINLSNSHSLTSISSLTTESLILRNCINFITLPEYLEVDLLDLTGCRSFKWPPPTPIEVGRLILNDCPGLDHIPDWITVSNTVDVANSGIRNLPDSLKHCHILWRGVTIDERIAFRPESITAEEILTERNVERRRVLIERFGLERFLGNVKHEILHHDWDRGGERNLLRLSFRDDEELCVLSVSCPSTGRRYFIRVPPRIRTCHEAAAWIAGFDDPDQYEPIVET